jgi:long-chain acyl-CoA synthetase
MTAVKDTLPKIFKNTCLTHPDLPALKVKDDAGNFQDTSYKALFEIVKALGTGLHHIGIKRGEHVGIISDNRPEWIATDLALLGLGAIDVPRGSDSTADEIAYILKHADCRVVFAENKAQFEKIVAHAKEFEHLKEIILYDMTGVDPKKAGGLSVHSYQEVLSEGQEEVKTEATLYEEGAREGHG